MRHRNLCCLHNSMTENARGTIKRTDRPGAPCYNCETFVPHNGGLEADASICSTCIIDHLKDVGMV